MDFPAAAFNTGFGNRGGHLVCAEVERSWASGLVFARELGFFFLFNGDS